MLTQEFVVCSELLSHGEASAEAVSINLDLGGLSLTPFRLGSSSGRAPAPFSETEQIALSGGVGVTLGLVQVNLTSIDGMCTTSVASDVQEDPTELGGQASASSELANGGGAVTVTIGGVSGPFFHPEPLLQIAGTAMRSSSTVVGTPGDLVTFGDSTLSDLTLSVRGSPFVPLSSLPGGTMNPAPNTAIDLSVLGLTGVRLVLNEQAITRDEGAATLSTTALLIQLNALNLVPGAPAISGSILLASSTAHLEGNTCP